ncbi:hypothetical protein ES703_100581 [subsurface metagenome]
MRECCTNLMVVCLSTALLYHFSLIAIRGTVTIREPNTLTLGLEMAVLVGLIIFAIFNLVRKVRSW